MALGLNNRINFFLFPFASQLQKRTFSWASVFTAIVGKLRTKEYQLQRDPKVWTMSTDIHDTDVDKQSFISRCLLAQKIKQESPSTLPILLYRHPAANECCSVDSFVTPTDENGKLKGFAAKASSLLNAMRRRVFGNSTAEDLRTEEDQRTMFKILAARSETLAQLCEKSRLYKTLSQRAKERAWRDNIDYDQVWKDRHAHMLNVDPLTTPPYDWSPKVVLYVSQPHVIPLHNEWTVEQVYKKFHGDDGFLRLYVSFEARRVNVSATLCV